jgi:multidrug resistance efflux pump
MVFLEDTTANYDIRLEQAQNALKNAEVSIESTKLQLDKTISDAQFALSKARADFQMMQDDSAKKLEKAERDVNKSLITATGSDAKVTLEKAELDYENLKASNIQTIKNLNATYDLSVNDLQKLLAKLLYQGDKTFGMTDKFRNETTTNRQYMGARDASSRTKLEAAYMELSNKNTELTTNSAVIVDGSNILRELQKLEIYYGSIRNYILATQTYLENSITSSSFPQATIDGFTTEYIGYKTELSLLETSYTTFKNTTSTFLATYKNNEASVAAGLEVQKKNLTTGEFESTLGLDRTKIGIDRDITQAQITRDSAEANYNNAVSNKEITLKKLAVSLTDAKLALEQAQKEFGKLSIVSPIDATVTRVNVSVGQEVSMGIPMIEIASRNPEIIFDLDTVAVSLLKVGSSQDVLYDGETYSGTVV